MYLFFKIWYHTLFFRFGFLNRFKPIKLLKKKKKKSRVCLESLDPDSIADTDIKILRKKHHKISNKSKLSIEYHSKPSYKVIFFDSNTDTNLNFCKC